MRAPLLVLFIVVVFSGCDSPEKQTLGSDGFFRITSKGITLKWKVVKSNLEVKLSAPTKGWTAVGFDPTNMMQDANLIIAYVKEGEPFIRDDYGSWLTSHASDISGGGSEDVILLEGRETESLTLISFIIPMSSGDKRDRPLVQGHEYDVLLAFGNKDDFSTVHRQKTKVTIILK